MQNVYNQEYMIFLVMVLKRDIYIEHKLGETPLNSQEISLLSSDTIQTSKQLRKKSQFFFTIFIQHTYTTS